MLIEYEMNNKTIAQPILSIVNKSDDTKLIQIKSFDKLLKLLLLQGKETIDLPIDKENIKNLSVEEVK